MTKKCLQQFQKRIERQGVKNQDLITDNLPTERTPGIQWNLEHDDLGFQGLNQAYFDNKMQPIFPIL